MFEVLQQGILGAFHIRSLLIAVVNRDEGFLEVVSAHPSSVNSRDPVGWRYDLSHPEILCDVVRTGRTEIIEGWDPRFHRRMVQPDGSLVFHQRTPEEVNPKDMAFFVPLKARDRVIGVAATGSTQAGKEIVLREIERMRPFLDQAGVTISIVSDTIKRRQAEEMLRENEARLKLALDAARMGTWDSNLLTGELIWSESMEPMFGLPPGTFSRTRDAFYECVDPEDRERVRQAVNLAIEEGTAFEVEHRIVWPNGEVRWIASKGRVFRDEMGRAGHMLGTALDITESRQAEEIQREAERTRVLVETAGAAAHEINQPLTVIIGLAQLMLMKESLDDAIRRDVESIQGAGQRIGAIVLKMQDLQKYITKPYLGESRIVDFEAATRKDP
ncbi:MAG: PAS domain S-box protein [Candidatus Latescibacteria bacterium]|nr:PAS domain S-box protein [Candidatus Latescibacterota bacterium]